MDVKLQRKGLDIEIKAKCENHDGIIDIITSKGAKFIGKFDMADKYFNVRTGRLKFREGDIEDILIQYDRENKNIKRSDFLVEIMPKNSSVMKMLEKTLGIKVIVKKSRRIYILDNIRFHIDDVESLGKFIEIEVRGETEDELPKLRKQIKEFLDLFQVQEENLIKGSYSDLVALKC